MVFSTFEILRSVLAALESTFEVIDGRALAPVQSHPCPGPFFPEGLLLYDCVTLVSSQ